MGVFGMGMKTVNILFYPKQKQNGGRKQKTENRKYNTKR